MSLTPILASKLTALGVDLDAAVANAAHLASALPDTASAAEIDRVVSAFRGAEPFWFPSAPVSKPAESSEERRDGETLTAWSSRLVTQRRAAPPVAHHYSGLTAQMIAMKREARRG